MSQFGKFITLEGGEGAGKSTNIAFVSDYLMQRGIDFCLTREPGGTEIAEKIREVLLQHHAEKLDPMAELLLVFAARSQHINRVIKPALEQGKWVVCDRFTDATYAYQGVARDLGPDLVEQLENLVQGELRPDKVILLDLDVELGFERVGQRGEKDRFELESKVFFEKVRSGYLQRAAAFPNRYAVVDAAQPISDVQKALKQTLNQLIASYD